MNILLTGATGFIGRRLAREIIAAGHGLVCAVRDPASAGALIDGATFVAIDFTRATSPDNWLPALDEIDLVINAVGILQETGKQRFDVLHHDAPCALFDASVTAGVRRIIQVSALGADDGAQSAYHLSKKAADAYLARLPISSAIVQPSLVFGPGGTSAKMFSSLARLPLIPLPGRGNQQVQPVHIDDLAAAILALASVDPVPAQRIPLVGPEPLSLKTFLAQLRRALGIRSQARFLPVPMTLVKIGAWLGTYVPGILLDRDTLQMLNRGNTGDPALMRSLLQRNPRPVEDFMHSTTA